MHKINTQVLSLISGIFLANLPAARAADPAPSTSQAGVESAVAQVKDSDKSRFTREVTEQKDLPNFHEVHPFLYRSGAPSEAGMAQVRSHGIKTIIDLRAPSERKGDEPEWAGKAGIKYINLPMSAKAPTQAQVDTFLNTVEDAHKHPDHGAVLVHCAHGSDRTGCLIGIWRVKHDGWSYDKAYKEMRHFWFGPKFTQLSATVERYAQQAGHKQK